MSFTQYRRLRLPVVHLRPGADLAGNLRAKYPPSIKLIKVPCSGRVEPRNT